MAPITFKSCPKVYIHETHRSKPPGDTLRFVEGMRDLLGMRDFREATALDRIGIPVFTCWRLRPDDSKTFHTGKGVSAIQAQVSLTLESIERFSSEFREEWADRLIVGSYNALRATRNTLDPTTLILSQFSDYTPDRDLHWVAGYDVASGEEILVPAKEVYHPFHRDEGILYGSHTNGLASGNTIEEAVFHALTEIVERDAWSIAKYNRNYGEPVAIEVTPENLFLIDIVRKFEEAGLEIIARDITSDVGIPVVAAFSKDLRHGDTLPIEGFGAHTDPKVAMGRALMEMATTRALFLVKNGPDGLRDTSPLYLTHDEAIDDPRFAVRSVKRLSQMEIGYSSDITEDLNACVARLRTHGLDRVIAVDLTRPETGIPTVRVVIPGTDAYCYDRTRKGDRLYGEM
jgi:ribosomal protein S12 methylthiotransferase accessory factor